MLFRSVVAGSAARVFRASLRESAHASGLLQALAVACVWDCARALALLMRTPHRGAARAAATAVP